MWQGNHHVSIYKGRSGNLYIFGCAHFACSYFWILGCSISATVVLLLSRCDSNEMVVYHKASRSLCRFDHTPQSQSYPMFDRCSSWLREWLCRTVSSKISLSPFSSVLLCMFIVLSYNHSIRAQSCSRIRIYFSWLTLPTKIKYDNLLHMKCLHNKNKKKKKKKKKIETCKSK